MPDLGKATHAGAFISICVPINKHKAEMVSVVYPSSCLRGAYRRVAHQEVYRCAQRVGVETKVVNTQLGAI